LSFVIFNADFAQLRADNLSQTWLIIGSIKKVRDIGQKKDKSPLPSIL